MQSCHQGKKKMLIEQVFDYYMIHMCYFLVLMSSLLFYNAENSKNKEKPCNEQVCPNLLATFDLYCIYFLLILRPNDHTRCRFTLTIFVNSLGTALHRCCYKHSVSQTQTPTPIHTKNKALILYTLIL